MFINEQEKLSEKLKVVYKYLKPYRLRLIVAQLAMMSVGAFDGAIAYSLKPFMDSVLIDKAIENSWYIPLLIVIFSFIQGIASYLATYLSEWTALKITTDIQKALFEKLVSFETSFFDKFNSGFVLTRFSDDPVCITNFIMNFKTFMMKFFTMVFLGIVLFISSWKLSLIAISVLLITIYPTKQVRKQIQSVSNNTMIINGEIINSYTEAVNGNRVISLYNLENYVSKKLSNFIDKFLRLKIKIIQRNSILTPVMRFIASLGIGLVIWYGSHLILTNQITSGAFVSFLVALVMLYNPLKGIGPVIVGMQLSLIGINRVIRLVNHESNIREEENALSIPSIRENICFKDVTFAYKRNVRVLNKINFEIKKGEKVALVGPSGGGKSTIINLLPRLYDVGSGEITFDNINIKKFKLQELRNLMSAVFQDNILFDCTIRENIMIGNPNASDEQLWQAIKDAYLEDFINSLEDGLETTVGERGVRLSGGQKQRIAIARALLKDAPILILDEATSALDSESEAIVQKALNRLVEDRTVIMIAHRLSTVNIADKIIFIENGEIIEIGKQDELLSNPDGAYRKLYETQFKETKIFNFS